MQGLQIGLPESVLRYSLTQVTIGFDSDCCHTLLVWTDRANGHSKREFKKFARGTREAETLIALFESREPQ